MVVVSFNIYTYSRLKMLFKLVMTMEGQKQNDENSLRLLSYQAYLRALKEVSTYFTQNNCISSVYKYFHR
uniref:HEPN domain-containing protein n=1 Tax=Caenorhabditis tropicalis TaxID=1561998 RepID=A0A1I7UYB3_9PELO